MPLRPHSAAPYRGWPAVWRWCAGFCAAATVLCGALVVTPYRSAEAVVTPALPVNARTDATIYVGPEGEGTFDPARNAFGFTASPGQTVTDRFRVENRGDVSAHLRIGATDAENAADGQITLLAPSQSPREAGTWITVTGPREFDLPANGSQVFSFSVRVPQDASPGDHAAGLYVSAVRPGDQVSLNQRIASLVTVRVPGELNPRLAIEEFQVDYGSFLGWWAPLGANYLIRNTGNVVMSADVTLSVPSAIGIEAGTSQKISVDTLLPGQAQRVVMTVPTVWALLALNPTVSLRAGPVLGAYGEPFSTSRGQWVAAIPWLAIGSAGALGTLGYLYQTRLRQRRRRGRRVASRAERRARRRH